jgi:hypothetical protein
MNGQGFGKMSRVHIPEIDIAWVVSYSEKELGLVILAQSATFFLNVTAKAEVIHRFRDQTEAVSLVAILRIDIYGVAIGAFRDAGIVGIDDFFSVCPRRTEEKSAYEEPPQDGPDPVSCLHRLLQRARRFQVGLPDTTPANSSPGPAARSQNDSAMKGSSINKTNVSVPQLQCSRLVRIENDGRSARSRDFKEKTGVGASLRKLYRTCVNPLILLNKSTMTECDFRWAPVGHRIRPPIEARPGVYETRRGPEGLAQRGVFCSHVCDSKAKEEESQLCEYPERLSS